MRVQVERVNQQHLELFIVADFSGLHKIAGFIFLTRFRADGDFQLLNQIQSHDLLGSLFHGAD
jgi:hypothetical protein